MHAVPKATLEATLEALLCYVRHGCFRAFMFALIEPVGFVGFVASFPGTTTGTFHAAQST
jgi:hypothetical protein